MKKLILAIYFLYLSAYAWAQVTTDPVFPIADQAVTITVDVSGTPLEGYANDIWIWAWIERASGDINAPTNQNPATDAESDALMTRSSNDGDIYTITMTPTAFFGVDADEIEEIGLLLKGRDWDDGKTPDYGFELLSNVFKVSFTQPTTFPVLVDAGQNMTISGAASENASLTLKIDDVAVATASNAMSITHSFAAAASGIHKVELNGSTSTEQATETFYYTVRSATVDAPRPAGMVDGINYGDDATTVTLSVWAPKKASVYLVGDFNDWNIDPAYLMQKDGEHFWMKVTGLIAGKEYAYQYLVDEEIWIADPYADKILDVDDKDIPESTYPNLMPYPEGAAHAHWYFNRAAVLQTNQTPYNWLNTDFVKPQKEDLLVYELLVRDFLGEEHMNYQSLIDTLGYIRDLGFNAIELMPIMEFNGNDSWGYNPTFMFAVDKAYGTKNDLKEFIDAAHGKGMAVILDMVMNQNDIPSPYAQMYFDFDNFRPRADNPWFNEFAKHPFNVFADINHESTYTRQWLDSINHYWLNEFHFDGYRFDLSKGFTQVDAKGSVSGWGHKDDSRIATLKRMADAIWSHTSDAYVILEHFADNDEEKILADYGMMLWGNASHDYNDAAKGFGENKSIRWASSATRNWNDQHLISYMESHDEERQLYNLLTYGNSLDDYTVKDFKTAIQRQKLAAAFFFTVPGPKMIWQWGEFGYDIPIDENGRTGRKPAKWEYLNSEGRHSLYVTYKELIKLRNTYDVFTKGTFSWEPDGFHKTIHTANADTSVVILGNFGLEAAGIDPDFQHTGTWYDFVSTGALEVTDQNAKISLEPGEFRIYTDHPLHAPQSGIVTAVGNLNHSDLFMCYPNPVKQELTIRMKASHTRLVGQSWSIIDVIGREVMHGNIGVDDELNLSVVNLPQGIYTFKSQLGTQVITKKIIKQ